MSQKYHYNPIKKTGGKLQFSITCILQLFLQSELKIYEIIYSM
uniref:Uncharacterized protein n=1 Tax=Anguilla anguilla TaxID=7936 RepID=A0A0E9QDM4_ANGAN